MKHILVVGCTGMLGEPVVNHLVEGGYSVHVLVRNKDKATAMFGNRVEYHEGDIISYADMESAMQGCDAVHFSVGGPNDPIGTQNVLDIGEKTGLKRFTYISGTTVDEKNAWFPMIKEKLEAEKMIQQSKVPYIIFRPTWPMEQLSNFIRDGRAFIIGKHPLPFKMFARNDLGRMVAKSFSDDRCLGKTLYIHGPKAITLKEAIDRYVKVLHPEIKSVSTLPIWLTKLIATLNKNDKMKFVASLMAYFEKVGELGDGAEADALLGAPETTLENWLEEKK